MQGELGLTVVTAPFIDFSAFSDGFGAARERDRLGAGWRVNLWVSAYSCMAHYPHRDPKRHSSEPRPSAAESERRFPPLLVTHDRVKLVDKTEQLRRLNFWCGSTGF
jgi:hypothetical protein